MAKTDTATKKSAKGTQNEKKAATTKSNHKQPQDKKNSTAKENSEKKQRKEQAKQEAKLMLKLEQAKGDVEKAEQKLTKAHKSLEEAQTQQHTLEDKLSTLRTPAQATSHNAASPASDEVSTESTDSTQVPGIPVPSDDARLTLLTPFIAQSIDTVDPTLTTDSTATATPPANEQADDTATSDTAAPTSMEADQPPAEGRTDISESTQEQNAADAAAPTNEQQNAASDTSSATPQGNTANSEGTQVGSDGVSMPIVSHDENAWPPPVIREEVAEAAQEEAATPSSTSEGDATAPTENIPAHSPTTHRRTRRTQSES